MNSCTWEKKSICFFPLKYLYRHTVFRYLSLFLVHIFNTLLPSMILILRVYNDGMIFWMIRIRCVNIFVPVHHHSQNHDLMISRKCSSLKKKMLSVTRGGGFEMMCLIMAHVGESNINCHRHIWTCPRTLPMSPRQLSH